MVRFCSISIRFSIQSSYDSNSASSLTVAASKKILVPGGPSDGSPPLTKELEAPTTEDPQVLEDVDAVTMEDEAISSLDVSSVSDDKTKVEETPTLLKGWLEPPIGYDTSKYYPFEDVASSVDDNTFTLDGLYEQINITRDATDYL